MCYHKMQKLQEQNVMVRDLAGHPLFEKVSRMKWYSGDEFEKRLIDIEKEIQELSPESLSTKI